METDLNVEAGNRDPNNNKGLLLKSGRGLMNTRPEVDPGHRQKGQIQTHF